VFRVGVVAELVQVFGHGQPVHLPDQSIAEILPVPFELELDFFTGRAVYSLSTSHSS